MESNKTQKKRGWLPAVVLTFLALCVFLACIGLYTDFFSPLTKYLPQSIAVNQSDTKSEDNHDHSDKESHKDHDHCEKQEGEHKDHDHCEKQEGEHKDHDHCEKQEGEHKDHDHCEKQEGEHKDHDHCEKQEGEHKDHDHEAEEKENADRLSLDDASLFNIGIKKDGELILKLQDYRKSFRMPGIVREIQGRSINNIATTVSGIVTRIEAKQGDALCPGATLLEIQLTHEEAIQCQTDLIVLLQKQDVIRMEEQRLGSLAEGIAPKQQRELLLQKVSNDAAIQSQKNLLKIHGFTDKMIKETVLEKRQAITQLVVRVPEINEDGITAQTAKQHSGNEKKEHYQILEKLLVNKGDSVRMGDILCQISDLRTLQIEGKAFASNENLVNDAFLKQSPVAAIFADAVKTDVRQTVDQLKIVRIDSFIDQTTQTVSCWINLPNSKLALSQEKSQPSTVSSCDEKTIQWRFKPGQRCELAIGYETIKGCFVLPPEAVALDRSSAFVFELTEIHEGKKVWTKKPVRILYRGSDAVVIACDETIRQGMKVAKTGAEQLYVALGSGSGKLQSACEHDH